MNMPKRLIVEYEDGSTEAVDFSQLTKSGQLELSKIGLCPSPSEITRNYVLLQWKDGWQEVIGVDWDPVELLKYFVIQRIEEIGRLPFEVGTYWPQMLMVKRMPREVRSLLIMGDGGAKRYNLEVEVETREGIFEAGGKKEYIKYDKNNPKYLQECSSGPETVAELMNSLRQELQRRGLEAAELLAKDESRRITEYIDIAREMGIRGMQRQEDVYGFVEFLVRKAT